MELKEQQKESGNVLVFQKSTNMLSKPTKSTSQTIKTMEMPQKSIQKNFQTSICSVEDSPVNRSLSQEREWALKTQEELSFLTSQGLLKSKDHNIFSLKMLKDYSITITGERLPLSLPHLMNWGIMQNGKCLTANILESHKIGKGVFIIGYLRGTSGQEIFPIRKSGSKNIKTYIKDKFQKTVYNINGISPTVREGHGDVIRIIQLNKPKHSTDRLYSTKGISRTIRSSAGGLGAKTGSYKTKLGIRKLTPIECERLQGFPDNWSIGSDSQRYKQLGNAVTVNVIEEIIKKWNQN